MNPKRFTLLGGIGAALAVAALSAVVVVLCRRSTGSPVPGPPAPPGVGSTIQGPLFTDMTADSGLEFTYHNGEEANHYSILESLGGGVALIDYDRDGLLDIFLPGGGFFDGPDKKQIRGHPNRLFRKHSAWKSRDVTADAGLPADGPFYSHGAAVCDYDNDGWPDLVVTGYGRLALYHNERGRFVDVTAAAGLADTGLMHWSTSAGWADLNGDRWTDLFIPHYVNWSFKTHPICDKLDQKPDIC